MNKSSASPMQPASTEFSPPYRILPNKKIEPDGQFIDMDFMASCSTTYTRWPWQKSMDSQEFGFASTLMNSLDVLAPADELFFKGQLLPLHMDHGQHLVQELSYEQQGNRRGTVISTRISHLCADKEEDIEDNSWCIGNEAGALITGKGNLSYAEGYRERHKLTADQGTCDIPKLNKIEEGYHCRAATTSNIMADHLPRLIKQDLSDQPTSLQRELSITSWCKGKGMSSRSQSGGIQSDTVFEGQAGNALLHPEQSLSEQDSTGSQSGLSVRSMKTKKVPTKLISPWYRDEELIFHSCRMERDYIDADYKARMGLDLRSSSFRSQNSGLWDSGPDKDSGDSSSSRDSNGSSQDSYLPSSTKLEAPLSVPQHPHIKSRYHIPWKFLFKKPSKKHSFSSSSSSLSSSSQQAISRKCFSEDLSTYALCSAPSLKGVKEPMMSWKLMGSVSNEQRSRHSQGNQGKGMGAYSSNGRSEGGHRSKSALSEEAQQNTSIPHTTTRLKRLVTIGEGGREEAEKEGMLRGKQREEDLKLRHWQVYARRLKHLCEVKKGMMGQFRLDECGKSAACEVECDSIYATRAIPRLQRRFSHQFSLFESHEHNIQEQHQGNLRTNRGRNTLAMSSCPPLTRGLPKQSGVLASKVMYSGAKIFDDSGTKSLGNRRHSTNKTGKAQSSGFPSSNHTSMSTIHELHSSLQSAIAHCKESNKRHDCQA